MEKHLLKFGKLFTNIACSPLILISNNSELAAKYLQNDLKQPFTKLEINNINNGLLPRVENIEGGNLLLAENKILIKKVFLSQK